MERVSRLNTILETVISATNSGNYRIAAHEV